MKTGLLMHLELSIYLSNIAFVSKSILEKVSPYFYGKDEVCGSIPHVGSKGKHPQVRVFSLTIKNFIVLSCVGS